MEHVSHFNQRMAIHSRNEVLICKVFLSSLRPVAMRWFDGLEEGSIGSYEELTRAIGAWFVMCNMVPRPLNSSMVPRPLNSLVSMAMREGETLKTYFDRYWETFNEIDGDFEDMAIRTFKVGLPKEHDLRKSLTMKPAKSTRQLIDHINEHKQVEEDQTQGKGKTKFSPLKIEVLRQRGIIIANPEESSLTNHQGIMHR